MKLWKIVATIIMLFVSPLVFSAGCDTCICKGDDTVNSCTECCKPAKTPGLNSTKLELQISDDGRAIVDQNGKEIARFSEGTKVRRATKGIKSTNQKLQGCWGPCSKDCVLYDENRQCLQWVKTCNWDFDCK